MNLASVLENQNVEKRVAITPEIAKKYINLGFNLSLQKSYATHLGFSDKEYESEGVTFFEDYKDIINNSDVLIQLGLPQEEKLSLLKENQTLVGSLNAFLNQDKLKN